MLAGILNFQNGTVTFPANVEYQNSGSDTWQEGGAAATLSSLGWTGLAEKSVPIRTAADAAHYASAERTFTIPGAGSIEAEEGFTLDMRMRWTNPYEIWTVLPDRKFSFWRKS